MRPEKRHGIWAAGELAGIRPSVCRVCGTANYQTHCVDARSPSPRGSPGRPVLVLVQVSSNGERGPTPVCGRLALQQLGIYCCLGYGQRRASGGSGRPEGGPASRSRPLGEMGSGEVTSQLELISEKSWSLAATRSSSSLTRPPALTRRCDSPPPQTTLSSLARCP